jgi:hypothetical protein
MEREDAAFSKIAQASNQVTTLLQQWLDAAPPHGRPKRLEDQMQKAVSQLITEIYAGKTEKVEERFRHLVEQTEVAHLPKKKVTFLQTLDAMQRVLNASRQWHQSAAHSRTEQDRALHKLLREVEAGWVENIDERFHQAMQNQSSTLHQSAEIFRDMMAEARITSENITDIRQRETIYAEVTVIVQETLETMLNKALPDTPTGQQLREEIERRNYRFLPEAQG